MKFKTKLIISVIVQILLILIIYKLFFAKPSSNDQKSSDDSQQKYSLINFIIYGTMAIVGIVILFFLYKRTQEPVSNIFNEYLHPNENSINPEYDGYLKYILNLPYGDSKEFFNNLSALDLTNLYFSSNYLQNDLLNNKLFIEIISDNVSIYKYGDAYNLAQTAKDSVITYLFLLNNYKNKNFIKSYLKNVTTRHISFNNYSTIQISKDIIYLYDLKNNTYSEMKIDENLFVVYQYEYYSIYIDKSTRNIFLFENLYFEEIIGGHYLGEGPYNFYGLNEYFICLFYKSGKIELLIYDIIGKEIIFSEILLNNVGKYEAKGIIIDGNKSITNFNEIPHNQGYHHDYSNHARCLIYGLTSYSCTLEISNKTVTLHRINLVGHKFLTGFNRFTEKIYIIREYELKISVNEYNFAENRLSPIIEIHKEYIGGGFSEFIYNVINSKRLIYIFIGEVYNEYSRVVIINPHTHKMLDSIDCTEKLLSVDTVSEVLFLYKDDITIYNIVGDEITLSNHLNIIPEKLVAFDNKVLLRDSKSNDFLLNFDTRSQKT